jgi:hypothetical protein
MFLRDQVNILSESPAHKTSFSTAIDKIGPSASKLPNSSPFSVEKTLTVLSFDPVKSLFSFTTIQFTRSLCPTYSRMNSAF